MKRIAVFLLVSIFIYFMIHITFRGFFNPQSIQIDNKIIKLPTNMYLKEVFSNNYKYGIFDLFLMSEPFIIEYPSQGMVSIILSNNENVIINLVPLLTKNTFEKFAEKKGKIKDNCIRTLKNGRIFLVDLKQDKGYILMSDNNQTQEYLVESICQK